MKISKRYKNVKKKTMKHMKGGSGKLGKPGGNSPKPGGNSPKPGGHKPGSFKSPGSPGPDGSPKAQTPIGPPKVDGSVGQTPKVPGLSGPPKVLITNAAAKIKALHESKKLDLVAKFQSNTTSNKTKKARELIEHIQEREKLLKVADPNYLKTKLLASGIQESDPHITKAYHELVRNQLAKKITNTTTNSTANKTAMAKELIEHIRSRSNTLPKPNPNYLMDKLRDAGIKNNNPHISKALESLQTSTSPTALASSPVVEKSPEVPPPLPPKLAPPLPPKLAPSLPPKLEPTSPTVVAKSQAVQSVKTIKEQVEVSRQAILNAKKKIKQALYDIEIDKKHANHIKASYSAIIKKFPFTNDKYNPEKQKNIEFMKQQLASIDSDTNAEINKYQKIIDEANTETKKHEETIANYEKNLQLNANLEGYVKEQNNSPPLTPKATSLSVVSPPADPPKATSPTVVATSPVVAQPTQVVEKPTTVATSTVSVVSPQAVVSQPKAVVLPQQEVVAKPTASVVSPPVASVVSPQKTTTLPVVVPTPLTKLQLKEEMTRRKAQNKLNKAKANHDSTTQKLASNLQTSQFNQRLDPKKIKTLVQHITSDPTKPDFKTLISLVKTLNHEHNYQIIGDALPFMNNFVKQNVISEMKNPKLDVSNIEKNLLEYIQTRDGKNSGLPLSAQYKILNDIEAAIKTNPKATKFDIVKKNIIEKLHAPYEAKTKELVSRIEPSIPLKDQEFKIRELISHIKDDPTKGDVFTKLKKLLPGNKNVQYIIKKMQTENVIATYNPNTRF